MGSVFSKTALFALLFHSSFAKSADLPLLTIQPQYVGENEGKSEKAPGKIVKYLTPEQQLSHKLVIKDGTFYKNGTLFDSSGGTFTYAEGEGVVYWGKAIVVLDENENLYTSLNKVEFVFHHSTLSAGQPVKFAGDMVIKNGKLIKFSNDSGHYIPSVKHVHEFMQYLEKNGVDIQNIQFDLNQGSFRAFFDTHPSPVEIQQLTDYTLEEALRYVSEYQDDSWFELYKEKIQQALEKHPQGLKHLLNTIDSKMSEKAISAVKPLLVLHSPELFKTSDRLIKLNNFFDTESIQQILEKNLKAALEKARISGLGYLNRIEMQTIGLYQKVKQVDWVDAEMLEMLRRGNYVDRIPSDKLSDLYENMRLWNFETFEQQVNQTSPPAVNVKKKCNPLDLLKKYFS